MTDDADFEYFEGTKTIAHPDGSTTYITTYHEPYVEPMTKKETAAVLGVMTGMVAAVVALPYLVEKVWDWTEYRKEVRAIKREKKLNDLKNQTEK